MLLDDVLIVCACLSLLDMEATDWDRSLGCRRALHEQTICKPRNALARASQDARCACEGSFDGSFVNRTRRIGVSKTADLVVIVQFSL